MRNRKNNYGNHLLPKNNFFTFSLGTRVYIQLDRKWRSKIDGLCGNFDGIADNELGDIVGTTVEEWGNSWKTENDAACPDVEPGKQTKCEVSI